MATPMHREPEWIATAPIRVERSRRIDASAEAVWAIIADHEAWPDWFGALDSVRVTGEPAGVGGRRKVKSGAVTVSEVFTAWEPNVQFAFTAVSAPRVLRSLAESVDITDVDDTGCTVVYTQGIEPAKGFAWLLKYVSRRLSAELVKALDALAAKAERAG